MRNNTPSVISGQQIGLLGGPLFMLYKILGVYLLTQDTRLQKEYSLPPDLQPVFWLEGNDADLKEIASFYGIDRRGEVKKYAWEPKQTRGQPIGNYAVDGDLLRLYREYFSALPITPHTDTVRDLVFQSYREGDTLLTANQIFFSQLFREFEAAFPGLKHMVWFCSDEEGFRRFSQTLLREEVAAVPEGEQCPVFALLGKRREALFKKKGVCQTRAGRQVDIHQATLLPSVWNRSVLQDAYWDARVYVAGPAEEKYLQKLLPRYQNYRIPPAKVVPRMSLTVIDREQVEGVRAIGFQPEEITSLSWEELVARLQERDPVLRESLKRIRKRLLQEKQAEVEKRKADGYEGIRRFEKESYIKMKHALGEKRKGFKKRQEKELTQLRKWVNHLHPQVGSRHFPQERFHNSVTFLNHYGLSGIRELYRHYEFSRKTMVF